MKKLVITALLFSVAVWGVKAQQQEEQKEPDEHIIINKKYDEQGNLIGYDSTSIRKWNMDTTFHFGFPDDGSSSQWDFPGIERFMKEFWNDSVFGNPSLPNQPFSFGFKFSPFGEKGFDQDNRPSFPDSLYSGEFPFQFDSLFFDFGFDSSDELPPGFDRESFEDFEKRLNRHFDRFQDENQSFPGFKNEDHLEEWEQLMEKHRQEIEELKKKWQDEE